MERELTCICCPIGCTLTVNLEEPMTVRGNSCRRGAEYGVNEVRNPRRTVTSSVRIHGGEIPMVSVKTTQPVPKDRVAACIREIHQITLQAPAAIGDVALEDCAGTGISVVVTKHVAKKADEVRTVRTEG